MAICRRWRRTRLAKDYDFAGLSQALLKAGTFNGKLTSMPMNIEGPILYYRTDILKKCGVDAADDHQGRRSRGAKDQGLRQQRSRRSSRAA